MAPFHNIFADLQLYTSPVFVSRHLMESLLDDTVLEVPTVEDTPALTICADDHSVCPDHTFCCILPSGKWGCCPVPNAVCCSEQTCCPEGMRCSTEDHLCLNGDQMIDGLRPVVPQSRSLPAAKLTRMSSINCPDGSECDDDSTCCLMVSGKYGCCPLKQAVCCSDKVHCCPNGDKCTSRGCRKSSLNTLLQNVAKLETATDVVFAPDNVAKVQCEGGKTTCPDETTCCKMASGDYSCCPMPNAVCCEDRIHCCAKGETCNVAQQSCDKGLQSRAWEDKAPSDNTTSPLVTILSNKENIVICPDKTSMCNKGQTCCMLQSGKYGCCQFEKAVCCSDKKHCCPHGTTCDVAEGSCKRGRETLSWMPKQPAAGQVPSHISVNSIICGDGKEECEDHQTCCKHGDHYQCCPMPKAVCCSDKEHCCPHGTTCDLQEKKCVHPPDDTTSTKITLHAGEKPCPGKKVWCANNSTCCLNKKGDYACCPAKDAVCCADMEHCCPVGYICDPVKGGCMKEDEMLSWTAKQHEASRVHTLDHTCPDGNTCPDSSTCCQMATGKYGCCPLPEAVCCHDKIHCCPNGYKCDDTSARCMRGEVSIPWFKKEFAKPVARVQCPDGKTSCPNGQTCCEMVSGKYGCCPMPKAECCPDKEHCCPQDFTCVTSEEICKHGDLSVPWSIKELAISVDSVLCPDKKSSCSDGQTCCLMASGKYGCCPEPKAVCCSDHDHCCPEGYTCDTTAGTCLKGLTSIPWSTKQPASLTDTIVCPGGKICPAHQTCCKLASGRDACCPLPNAVCCGDHEHCCPEGYTCDSSEQSCKKGDKSVPWVKKEVAAPVERTLCPDKESTCPNGQTCCMMGSGQYGCCPIAKAVCCSDHEHCCPHGSSCDSTKKICHLGEISIPWLTKQPSHPIGKLVCPGGKVCPDHQTCCKLSSGKDACCPLPNAVCCPDHQHCCPEDFVCDQTQEICSRGNEKIPWVAKHPATSGDNMMSRIMANIVCPGGMVCAEHQTCCKLLSGKDACCPLPKAVCCRDHKHCCPDGYVCDSTQEICTKGEKSVPWSVKLSAMPVDRVQCPDKKSSCTNGQTCCLLPSGKYGCCPIPKAVCCSDHHHCCPEGYICDSSEQSCLHGDTVLPWFEKQTAQSLREVICPDKSACPAESTCCKMQGGKYGCCPQPNAVCCSDKLHCCPHKSKCDVAQQKCVQETLSIPWSTKQPSLPSGPVEILKKVIHCPDKKAKCPDSSTCCKLPTGQWGCCPIPNALCCSDGVHCCPEGTHCDTQKGTCASVPHYRSAGTVQMTRAQWISEPDILNKLNAVACKDGSHCPDGSTCCETTTAGKYACCPHPNGVCCSDHSHCCAEGYICDIKAGKCNKTSHAESKRILGLLPQQSRREAEDDHKIPCQCPKGDTCCTLPGGMPGCCPYSNAVCCSDKKHCCPHGYTCETTGKCKHLNLPDTMAVFIQKVSSTGGN